MGTNAEESNKTWFVDDKNHPLGIQRDSMEYYNLGHPHQWTQQQLDVQLTHLEPKGFLDKAAYHSVQLVRRIFDTATGWRMDNIKVENTLNRVIYLETIAAVPGMVAAVVRHFRSLRQMKSDGGLLQMFLEEANNERYVLENSLNGFDLSIKYNISYLKHSILIQPIS